jgi:hypothetical protein
MMDGIPEEQQAVVNMRDDLGYSATAENCAIGNAGEGERRAGACHTFSKLCFIFDIEFNVYNIGGNGTGMFFKKLLKLGTEYCHIVDGGGYHKSLLTYHHKFCGSFEEQYTDNYKHYEQLSNLLGRLAMLERLCNDKRLSLIDQPGQLEDKMICWNAEQNGRPTLWVREMMAKEGIDEETGKSIYLVCIGNGGCKSKVKIALQYRKSIRPDLSCDRFVELIAEVGVEPLLKTLWMKKYVS